MANRSAPKNTLSLRGVAAEPGAVNTLKHIPSCPLPLEVFANLKLRCERFALEGGIMRADVL